MFAQNEMSRMNLMNAPGAANLMNAMTPPMTPPSAPIGEGCLGWNSELSTDGQPFVELPEGTYLATVVHFERGRHEASARLPACNKAILGFEIKTPEGITVRVRTDLYLYTTMVWKISAFFRAIGRKRKGETIQMDWTNIVGSVCLLKVKPGAFKGKDGEMHPMNEIVDFVDYDANLIRQMMHQEQPVFTDVTADTDVPF